MPENITEVVIDNDFREEIKIGDEITVDLRINK